jgi:uncharacterized secreted protein with C-terminal beta-propeller domain
VYLVTAIQVQRVFKDPLFVIDLSDSTKPVEQAALDIPGFSTYIHPIGDTHLVTLGRTGNTDSAWDGDLQLSLFDVRNPEAPKRVDTFEINVGNSTWTEAQNNHLAFQYFDEQGVIALPVSKWSQQGGVFGTELIKLDVATGFEEVGSVELSGDSWSSRVLRIEDKVFSVTPTEIVAADIDDATVTDSVEIEPDPRPRNGFIGGYATID